MPASQKGIAHLLLIVLVVLGIGVGIYLVKNPTIFNPKADFEGTDNRYYPVVATDAPEFQTCSKNPDTCPSGYTCDVSPTIYDDIHAVGSADNNYQPSGMCKLSQESDCKNACAAEGMVCIQGECQPEIGDSPYSKPFDGKLSNRLDQLLKASLNGTLPANIQDQNIMLGLAPSGSGSLSRMSNGRVVVDVRLQDTSSAVQSELTNAGAEILSVSPVYRNMTLGIGINELNNLTNIQAVEAVMEVITPSHGSP